jgi:hypothetical protein
MISGASMALVAAPAKGLLRRILKSPCEYSNSSRLCSVIKRSNCSICWMSGFAKVGLAVGFGDFLCFMPLLDLYKIPRNAGEHFRTLSVHGNVVFDANSTRAWHVDTWLNRDHVSRL